MTQVNKKSKIYVLGPLCDRKPSRKFATSREELSQMAVDQYWGTLIKPPKGRLKVFVKLLSGVPRVIIKDTYDDTETVYKILVFARLMA